MVRAPSLALLILAACGPSPDPGTDAGPPGPGVDAGPRPDSGPPPDGGPPQACDPFPDFTGEGTYYAADGTGACSFDAHTGSDELLIAAMNAPQWAGSGVCGMCARVTGPMGEVTVRIVDLCPECAMGDLDLSPQAFDHIAERALGRVPITWREVPCDVTGPIEWRIKEGSNQWWTAVQVREHRHRIASVAIRGDDGTWRDVPRLDYNFFVDTAGFGPGPFTLRATDVHGNVLEDTGITLTEAVDQPGAAQLPPCE
jgi:expansin (peptidoglycan-binding protein)